MIEIKVPAAGESVTEADIASWSKSDGDFVELDDVLVELETDKASLELTAEATGKLSILVEDGTVKVGQLIAKIDTEVINTTTKVSSETANLVVAEKSSSAEIKRIDITVPAAGESVNEADIASWSKSDGDFVELDDVLVELETDKASLELTAEVAGNLSILVEDGTVKVGDIIAYITTGDVSGNFQKDNIHTISKANLNVDKNYAKGYPSPAAAKLMSENNIQLSEGTGKNNRITKSDILDEINKSEENKKILSKENSQYSEANFVTPLERTVRRERMSRIRRTISSRLVEAQQTAALLTTFNEIDMSAIMEIRKKYKEAFKEKYNVGLGFMSFFAKATSIALKTFQILNAQIDEDENEIIYHDYVDIGIAVSTPRGLVVPVVKDVQSLSFQDVEKTILDFALKGRDGQLTPDEMTGGTFTITNGGTFGSMLSTPIVNRPQSAILGMHNIIQRPVAVNGNIEIRPIMYLAVTYDHRIIDGVEAVRFLVNVKELLEDPTRIMLDV